MSWDTCSLQNEFPTDARRGSELAGDGNVDKEGDTGPFLVSSLEVTHRESRSPSAAGTVGWGPGLWATPHREGILRLWSQLTPN